MDASAIVILDNGGETFDRYTVIFPDGDALAIGDTGNVPNGVCMHVTYDPAWVAETSDARVEFGTLPAPVQRAIIAEWNAYYRDAVQP